jgi:hypothetical protein
MRGAIPLLPQHAFMAWCSVKKSTGTTLPLPLEITYIIVFVFSSTPISEEWITSLHAICMHLRFRSFNKYLFLKPHYFLTYPRSIFCRGNAVQRLICIVKRKILEMKLYRFFRLDRRSKTKIPRQYYSGWCGNLPPHKAGRKGVVIAWVYSAVLSTTPWRPEVWRHVLKDTGIKMEWSTSFTLRLCLVSEKVSLDMC